MMFALLALVLTAWTWPGHGSKAGAQAPAAPAATSGDSIGRFTFADLADKVLPSVVTVYVKRDMKASMSPEEREKLEKFKQFFNNPQFRQFFGPDGPGMPDNGDEDQNPFIAQSSGSGVIISADGYIITNWHVVGDLSDKSDIRLVFSDDTEVKGADVKLVFSHQVADLAILKVNKSGLTPVKWGNSDNLRIGERVAAIGSPLDLRATITQGIICAKHRDVDGSAGDMLQTDAVINPGSSGGALVNLDGELVGINRLITTNSGRWQGYGFAIPANDAKSFADQVVSKGKVSYGYIGITMGSALEDTPKMREALGIDKDHKGVLISAISPDGPADKAGLRVGDFITRADETDIESSSELLRFVMRRKVGDTINLHVLRADEDGKLAEKTLKLRVSERPDQKELEAQLRGMPQKPNATPTPKPEENQAMLGLSLEPYEQDGSKGLRVTDVAPESPAARAGISQGDILISLNRVTLQTMDDFTRALKKKVAGRQHVVQIIHSGRLTLATIDEK
jgi:S1-C subfamily serine protease